MVTAVGNYLRRPRMSLAQLFWWRRGELNLFMLLKTRKLLISLFH